MKMMCAALGILLAILLLGSADLRAQGDEESAPVIDENSAGNTVVVGARGLAMAGSQIAAGMDGTVLVYNPALLARIRRIELLASMSHEGLSNDENRAGTGYITNSALDGTSKSFTRLNSLNITVPVPTYRGSAVVAFGVNRSTSFDQVFRYSRSLQDGSKPETGAEYESGGLYVYSAGGAMDFSPRVSAGVSLNLYHGKDNYTWARAYIGSDDQLGSYSEYVSAKYTGVSAKVGVAAVVNEYVSLGAVVESPISYDIDGDYAGPGPDYTYEYELKHPFRFGFGAAMNVSRLQLALDLRYADWRQMEYTQYDLYRIENSLMNTYYREALSFGIGAEYLVPQIGAKIRAGYLYDPLPYAGFLVENDRDYFSFGAGFLIDRVMTLDIAFVTGSYEFARPEPDADGTMNISKAIFEKYTVNRLYVTTAFRL
jgi:long-subunit fatty acid transport protein